MKKIIRAACHCQSINFEVILIDGFNTIRRCNCSFCRMRGAIAVSANLKDLKITKGQENLTEYRFGSKEAVHFFCKICGIYTFHQRRSNPEQYGINVACLEDTSPFDFVDIPVLDGINHPNDGGGGIIGYLKYENK